MNEREATQWLLVSVATTLAAGSLITLLHGNIAATLIQSSSAGMISRFISGDEEENEESDSDLTRTYKVLAKDSPEALEAWMSSLPDEDVEYIYDKAINSPRGRN